MQILINQLGYRPQDEKKAVFRGARPECFFVIDKKTQDVVTKKSVFTRVLNQDTMEEEYIGDFTEINREGVYEIVTEGKSHSFPFTIEEEVYGPLKVSLARMFYLHRCGIRLDAKYVGNFSHVACHNTPATIWGTNQRINVNGGWHDAGDYGRYVVAAAVTVADLLMAYESSADDFKILFGRKDKGDVLPELLDEIKYELDWMLKMQNPETGEVYHKVTCKGFPSYVMPECETEELFVLPPSVTATADFAASMAMAERFYRPYDVEYADKCLNAAIKAYDAQSRMYQPGGFHNPEGCVTGEYEDNVDTDERFWAAAEMYRTTGKKEYREDFERLYREKVPSGYGWREVGSFGHICYLSTDYPTDPTIAGEIRDRIIHQADEILKKTATNAYGVSLSGDYVWGSNMVVANNGILLCDAYSLTGNQKYRNAARDQVHYLLGRNPLNMCFVTGMGSNCPAHPHHRPSAAKEEAMKGMLVGGPDGGIHDPVIESLFRHTPAALCYADDLESYSTNEVTIYWNSSLIALLTRI